MLERNEVNDYLRDYELYLESDEAFDALHMDQRDFGATVWKAAFEAGKLAGLKQALEIADSYDSYDFAWNIASDISDEIDDLKD